MTSTMVALLRGVWRGVRRLAPRNLFFAVACAVVAACRCEPGSMSVEGEIRVAPRSLDFGTVPLQAALSLEVELSNTSKASRAVTLTLDGPFTASASTLTLQGAASSRLQVTFAPTALGPVNGVLHVTSEEVTVDVALSANGAAACSTSLACRSSGFDVETRACVEAPLVDGSTCTNACLTMASCQAGTCVGTAKDCSDGDACTDDACAGEGSCFHTPKVCPIVDPCQVASCDPVSGCGSTPVQDGISCGPETCAEARICLSGTCQTRTKPNAATDCAYSEVVAGQEHTCVRSLGGDAYCWGMPRSFGQSRRYLSARAAVPSLDDAQTLYAGPLSTCALRDAGYFCEGNSGGGAGSFSAPPRKFEGSCALLDSGVVECPQGFNSLDDGGRFGSSNAVALSVVGDVVCIGFDDGVAECRTRAGSHLTQRVTFDAVPLDLFALGGGGRFCGLLSGGKLQCAGGNGTLDTLVDAGVRAVGGDNREICFADAVGVKCQQYPGFNGVVRDVVLPAPVRQLTLHGEGHVCALTTTNEVWCWGSNAHGQLGDRSPQPSGIVELSAPSGITQLSLGEHVTVALAGSELWSHGAEFAKLDGGAGTGPSARGSVLLGTPPPFAALSVMRDLGCLQLLDAGVSCWGGRRFYVDSKGLTPVALPAPASKPSLCTADFETLCTVAREQVFGLGWLAPGPAVAGELGVRQIEGRYLLRPDGGVDARSYAPPPGPLMWRNVSVPLPGPVTRLGSRVDAAFNTDAQGCAQLANGRVVSWSCNGTGVCQPAEEIQGLLFPRTLVGNIYGGCAVYGANGVRCWGDNAYGQLARDDLEYSAAALDVAMPEAVVSLVASPTHVCALTVSKKALCWGDNTYGQLGFEPLMMTQVPRRLQ